MANQNDPRTPASRQEVFRALDTERDYQLRRWGVRKTEGDREVFVESAKSVNDFLVYMDDYLHHAKHAATHSSGSAAALDDLRKVVALGIACFEQHGIEPREVGDGVVNARDGKLA